MINLVEKPNFRHAWRVVSPSLSIRTEHDYKRAVQMLDGLLDEIGDNEHHPLSSYLEVLGTLIENYETDHIEITKASTVDVLKFLMEQRGLSQGDFQDEIGSQGVVSEILHGKRELNARQIKALSERFGVSPAVFF